MDAPVTVHELRRGKVDSSRDDRPSLVFGQAVLRHDKVACLSESVHHRLVNVRCAVDLTRVFLVSLEVVRLRESMNNPLRIRRTQGEIDGSQAGSKVLRLDYGKLELARDLKREEKHANVS